MWFKCLDKLLQLLLSIRTISLQTKCLYELFNKHSHSILVDYCFNCSSMLCLSIIWQNVRWAERNANKNKMRLHCIQAEKFIFAFDNIINFNGASAVRKLSAFFFFVSPARTLSVFFFYILIFVDIVSDDKRLVNSVPTACHWKRINKHKHDIFIHV